MPTGTMQQIAEDLRVQAALVEQGEVETFTPAETDSDVASYPAEGNPGGGCHQF